MFLVRFFLLLSFIKIIIIFYFCEQFNICAHILKSINFLHIRDLVCKNIQKKLKESGTSSKFTYIFHIHGRFFNSYIVF
jgi:hypothetical protein